MESFNKIQRFFSYWYVRYLLATELYMVETWEKVIVHVVFCLIFGLMWLFNYCIVLSTIARIRGTYQHIEIVS